MRADLARDGQRVRAIRGLNGAANALDGGEERADFVWAEVCEAGHDARGDDEDVWRRHALLARVCAGAHARPRTMGFRFTIANASGVR